MATVKKKMIIRKKIWVPLEAPEFFNHAHLGDAFVYDAKEALGKRVTINLSMLVRDPKKQNINVSFDVVQIVDQTGNTRLVEYGVIPSAMKRLVRRGKSKICDSFTAISADGEYLRIKPLLITRSKAKKAVETALRMGLRAYIIKTLRKTKTEEFFKNIVQGKLQKESADLLKKIYPLGLCEIRSLEILKREKAPVQEMQEEVKEDTPESEPEKESEEELQNEAPQTESN
ncbi:hypothetical protein J4410_06520 [Candidatus Woesearchaeota archaeon]|nr:hypothetical protein [Candidatus Woesearchaeota archaeon]